MIYKQDTYEKSKILTASLTYIISEIKWGKSGCVHIMYVL